MNEKDVNLVLEKSEEICNDLSLRSWKGKP